MVQTTPGYKRQRGRPGARHKRTVKADGSTYTYSSRSKKGYNRGTLLDETELLPGSRRYVDHSQRTIKHLLQINYRLKIR